MKAECIKKLTVAQNYHNRSQPIICAEEANNQCALCRTNGRKSLLQSRTTTIK